MREYFNCFVTWSTCPYLGPRKTLSIPWLFGIVFKVFVKDFIQTLFPSLFSSLPPEGFLRWGLLSRWSISITSCISEDKDPLHYGSWKNLQDSIHVSTCMKSDRLDYDSFYGCPGNSFMSFLHREFYFA